MRRPEEVVRAGRLLVGLLAGLSFAAQACHRDPAPPRVPGPTTAIPKDGRVEADISPASLSAKQGKLVSLRHPDSKVVSFRIAFAAGSADDPPSREGLTYMAAALAAEGGTASLTYPELLEKLFPMAASIQVNVDRDETVFSADVTTDSLDEFYPMLRDVVLTPRFDGEGFERVRAKQRSALVDDLRGANDEALGKEGLEALLYEGHPYGHPVVGTVGGIEQATLPELKAQYAKVFCKERLLLGLAGGFPEGFDKNVERELKGRLPACGAARSELPAPKAADRTRVLVVDKPSAEATAISIGFPTELTRANPDFPAVAFVTDYLGLHRQSAGRLYHELRELRGLNYGNYAYPEYFEQEGWSRYPAPNVVRRQQHMSLWLRPVKPKNAIFALRAALSVRKELMDKGIGEGEIERFRTFLSRYRGLEQQTESRRLGYAMDDLAYALPAPYLETMRAGWDKLDSQAVRSVIDRHWGSKPLAIVIVAKNGKQLAADLVKGKDSFPTYDGPKPANVTDYDKVIAKLPLDLRAEDVRVVPVDDIFE